MIRVVFSFLILTFSLPFALNSLATEVVLVGAHGNNDYRTKVIKAALAHTEQQGKKTKLSSLPPASKEKMFDLVRSKPEQLRVGQATNIQIVVDDPELSVIPFPMQRGVMGYRVCFTSAKLHEQANTINSLESLSKFTLGVGAEWFDKDIFDLNNLKSVEVGYFFFIDKQINSLYEMTALSRIDLFCRGINEIIRERKTQPAVKKLILNKSFALRYKMPFFLYVHKNNKDLKDRLQKGLDLIHENGVFERLWKAEYQESIDFVNMDDRTIIELESEKVPVDKQRYEKYLYKPKNQQLEKTSLKPVIPDSPNIKRHKQKTAEREPFN